MCIRDRVRAADRVGGTGADSAPIIERDKLGRAAAGRGAVPERLEGRVRVWGVLKDQVTEGLVESSSPSGHPGNPEGEETGQGLLGEMGSSKITRSAGSTRGLLLKYTQ